MISMSADILASEQPQMPKYIFLVYIRASKTKNTKFRSHNDSM